MNKVSGNITEDSIKIYEHHIKTLNVPDDKKIGSPTNARWFIRQGYVFNRDNPVADQVLDAARKIA